MAKRLSAEQKEEIIKSFTGGKNVDELSKEFTCNKLTIIRNLKKTIGEEKYKELIQKRNYQNISLDNQNLLQKIQVTEIDTNQKTNNETLDREEFPITPFIEITPLNFEIDNKPQKDLSSVPISEVEFPKIVYMIVDKKIELEIKYLKDYPDWQFLSTNELNRKTIEIFIDLKMAKRICKKEQKVIKVPNTDVFKIVAPLLLAKGISRIVSYDKLISL